ncbi:unnamed protein product [Didymodactylos carnosus]|uniref:Uncharacterized protein n=1 Tax=Didymodactylos carnosus TaxID=1234261 RepID=A0A815R9C5_9BILA|nr:unnamed protein product [Didymodactylos carnosus]CAF4340696.1 unnamed protein product [Didymodactylos carnosus]
MVNRKSQRQSSATTIGALNAKAANGWSTLFVQGDFEEFSAENTGGKRSDSFWDVFPTLELEARAFVVEQCSKKSSSFTVADLATFNDQRYDEITGSLTSSGLGRLLHVG